jgi:hypothetical protein
VSDTRIDVPDGLCGIDDILNGKESNGQPNR